MIAGRETGPDEKWFGVRELVPEWFKMRGALGRKSQGGDGGGHL